MINRIHTSLSPGTRLLLSNAALALGYYATAVLGMAMSIGPLHITAIWPPSGIALAGFVLSGWRALPGLALGAFAMNYLSFLGPLLGAGAPALAGSMVLSAGALAQAGLAASMVRDLPGRLLLSPVRQTIRFAGVIGTCCLISASVGQATLNALGAIPGPAVFFGWLTWWVGDAAGMLIIAPAALLLVHPAFEGRRVAVQAFPIICLGLGLTLFSTLSVSVMDRDVRIERFRADGTRLAMALQNHIDMAARDLEILQRLFYGVELQPTEFRAVSGPMLERSPWQQDFSFLPLVPLAHREGFEDRINAAIREVSPRDTVVKAGVRPEYCPVLWTDPESGHDALVGIDHLADPQRGQAVQKARASGRLTASVPLHSLAKSASSDLVQVLYAPLAGLNRRADAAYDPDAVRGLVAATIDIGQLLRAALAQMGVGSHRMLLFDPEATGSAALSWSTDGRLAWLSQAEREQIVPQINSGIHHEVTLQVADRHWQLLMQPAWAQFAPQPDWLQAGVFLSGLAITALLTGFMVARRRHDQLLVSARQALETEVAARTAELANTNETLRAEIGVRQRAERDLHVFRWLAESAHQGLGISELDGKVIYLNPALRKIADDLDWAPSNARMLRDYFGPSFKQQFEADVVPMLAKTGYWDGTWHVDAQGERPERWLAVSHFVLRDDLGQPMYMASLITDNTAQRTAERDLRVFRWFAESAQLGFGIADFDYRMIYMNPALRTMAGQVDWKPGGARKMIDYLGRDFRRRFLDEAMPILRDGGSWTGEMRRRARGEQPEGWFAQTHFVVRDDEGHPLYLANITKDVTEQRKLENDLRDARARADEASKAKSMFLANMSHEIRTPLNAVLGFAQILLADRQLSAEAHQRLQIILSAGNRLLGLISDVLDLAKIESGRLILTPEPMDLHRELLDIASMFAGRVSNKGLAWRVDVDDLPAPCTVLGDRTKIGQVVINLLGNALKFTEQGHIHLRAWQQGSEYRVEVDDSGLGMEATEIEQLFSPFSQGEAGRAKGGSGLGLVLSREIARAMGGELTLDSEPGRGTRATVALPLPSTDSSAPDPMAETQLAYLAPSTPCRALVVEDDPDSRDLLVKLLRDAGCTVHAAIDGQAGLDACLADRPDIVFSDIRMPVMDGFQLIKALRADPAMRALPVIAVTASSLEHERRYYIEIGFQDFVPKPYPFREIYRMLAQYAGARFTVAPQRTPEQDALPSALPPLALNDDVATHLRELQAAAADGDLGRVKQALSQVAPAIVGETRHRGWEELARHYDFARLEEAVREFLTQASTLT